ncbi:hypothetical protein NHN17_22360 [Photobacterium sp. ZSDE20]|uniref:Uncharacterized protein n=2 Tax=Photobacterium pectinilyticum TaxID=2906793 RepID=A0ABT1N7T0_9GAMM|nr:hypothetical protein [Photobacterium sp. ZSDE20]
MLKITVLFGAVMSSFNSGVNSLSTLVSLDIYKQIINPKADAMFP